MVIGLILFGLIYSLLLNSSPKLTATSQDYHPLATYQKAVQQEFSSLKNRSKLTLDQRQIEVNLKKQFPEIAAAPVSLSLVSQTATVKLAIAQPSVVLNNGAGSYVVSTQGIAVARVSDLSTTAKKLTVLNDQSGLKITAGQPVLSSREIDFINQLIVQCQRSNVPIQTITLPPIAQELDLRTTDRPYFIKFYLGSEALSQIGQFLAARQQLNSGDNQPQEYLDVRVVGKIYYR